MHESANIALPGLETFLADEPTDLLKLEIEQWNTVAAEWGPLVAPALAAKLCGMSAQAVASLIARAKLNSWQFFGREWVSLPELRRLRTSPRERGGRPRKQDAA